MPANLTHGYLKAERAYRQASGPEEELLCLKRMLRELPKHKGTDRLQSDLKQKISQATRELEKARSNKQKAYTVRFPRQGAGRAVLLGGPNAGKSSLLAALTRAEPEIGDYPFTTRDPEVGMMPWQDVLVQLIDTPPVTKDYCESYIQGLVRGADLVVLTIDISCEVGVADGRSVIELLDSTKTRLGVTNRLDPHDIGRSYTHTIIAATKSDKRHASLEPFREHAKVEFRSFAVSATAGEGISELRRGIYESLDVVRVYTKSPNEKEPDLTNPFTIRRGQTLYEVAEQIHADFANQLKFARVWGKQIHDATRVKAEYEPTDGDIVELHL